MTPNFLKTFSVFEVFKTKLTFGMPKNSYQTDYFNEMFSRLQEAGIIEKFTGLYYNFYALKNYVPVKTENLWL